jgi:hypothetical protein
MSDPPNFDLIPALDEVQQRITEVEQQIKKMEEK